jgi:hypothetical protein
LVDTVDQKLEAVPTGPLQTDVRRHRERQRDGHLFPRLNVPGVRDTELDIDLGGFLPVFPSQPNVKLVGSIGLGGMNEYSEREGKGSQGCGIAGAIDPGNAAAQDV